MFFDANDDSAWQQVLVADIDAVIIADVDGGDTGDGATWYGAMRAYNASDTEIGIINTSLTGTSAGEKIAISDDAVYIGKENFKFYTDNTFTTRDNSSDNNELDLTLTIENIGATIGSSLSVNDGAVLSGGIQASGNVPNGNILTIQNPVQAIGN